MANSRVINTRSYCHRLSVLGWLLVASALPYISEVAAEARCEGLLSYSWKVFGPEAEGASGLAKPTDEKSAAVSDNSDTKVVPIRRIEAIGLTEDEARLNFADRKAKAVIDALQVCRQRHENYAGCIASRYAQLSGQINSLSFTARRQLEDAIKSECDGIRGVCTGGEVTEPTCVDLTPKNPDQEGAGQAAEGDSKEKGKKGKR